MGILLAVLVIGLLIVIHELGHMLAAKRFGITVETFSIGFGPKIAGFKRWGTDFIVCVVPFGGYVKMKGADPAGLEGTPDEFLSRGFWVKTSVVMAGPAANLLAGFLLFMVSVGAFGVTDIPGNLVGAVEEGSAAWEAGLRPGDRVLLVDGGPFPGWGRTLEAIERGAELSLERGTERLALHLSTFRGAMPAIEPTVGGVLPGGAGEAAGFVKGDRVLSVNGEETLDWSRFVELVRSAPGESLSVLVNRAEERLLLQVVPDSEWGEEGEVGKLGLAVRTVNRSLSPVGTVVKAGASTLLSTGLMFQVLYRLVSGGLSLRAIGGPLMIGKAVGESAALGAQNVLNIAGLISVNLFVVNVLPIPALDGGHQTIFSLEALLRRKIPPRAHTWLQMMGFAVVISLMLVITLLDVQRIWFGG